MQGIVTFIFGTVLILGALVTFFVLLVGGWIVGTVYLWIEGAADSEDRPAVKQLTWWNRRDRQ